MDERSNDRGQSKSGLFCQSCFGYINNQRLPCAGYMYCRKNIQRRSSMCHAANYGHKQIMPNWNWTPINHFFWMGTVGLNLMFCHLSVCWFGTRPCGLLCCREMSNYEIFTFQTWLWNWDLKNNNQVLTIFPLFYDVYEIMDYGEIDRSCLFDQNKAFDVVWTVAENKLPTKKGSWFSSEAYNHAELILILCQWEGIVLPGVGRSIFCLIPELFQNG